MTEITLGLEDVKVICPDCASEMVQKGLQEVTLEDFAVVYKAKSKKGGMSTEDPGLFTRCMKTAGAQKASDPAAYCASVHKKISGMWPGEHGGKNPMGPEKKSATVVDVVSEIVKAGTRAGSKKAHEVMGHKVGGQTEQANSLMLAKRKKSELRKAYETANAAHESAKAKGAKGGDLQKLFISAKSAWEAYADASKGLRETKYPG